MSKTIRNIIVALPFAIGSVTASAVNTANVNQLGLRNATFLTQRADDNFVDALQDGTDNLATINQAGALNTANLSQIGVSNQITLGQQTGNVADVAQNGANSIALLNQGNGNSALILQVDLTPRGGRVELSQDVANVAFIDQGGVDNTVNVQQGQGNSLEVVHRGSANITNVSQLDSNSAVLITSGDFGVVDVQQGFANLAFTGQGGLGTSTDPNLIVIVQDSVPGLDEAHASQNGGAGNEIEIRQSSDVATFANVNQTGDGNRTVVFQ